MSFNRTTRRVTSDPLFGTQPIAGIKKATGDAQQATTTAAQTGAQYGQAAQGIGSQLVPQLEADVNNPQGFSQGQQNNMLVQGLEGAGGAAGGVVGQANLEAARSRNVGGQAGVLDEAARDKTRAGAAVAQGVATKNAELQQQQRASALEQLQGLYGTDVNAGLKAQSLVPEDIDAWAKANQTGWVQNVDETLAALKPSFGAPLPGGGSIGMGH